MMRVAILGSTGSIGVSTLDVLGRHRDRFEVVALAAASNHVRLLEQCRAHRPRVAVLTDPRAGARTRVGLARRRSRHRGGLRAGRTRGHRSRRRTSTR